MNASDRRRLYERAGILMLTKGMDPTQAILEAARQLGITSEGTVNRTQRFDPAVEKERPR
jgi:hypothetical protein